MPGQINRIMAGLEALIEGEVRGLAGDVVRELSEATPKDTGWAAASWKPNIGGPLPDPIVPAGNVPEQRAEQLRRLVTLLQYRLAFGSIHIANTAGYTAELDARRPFVEAAIDRAVTGRQARGLARVRRRP